MANLLTQYTNGTFEGAQATWNESFINFSGSQDNVVFYEGLNSCKITTVEIDRNLAPGGIIQSISGNFPGSRYKSYRVSCRVKVSADFPDELVLFLVPNVLDETQQNPGFTVPVRASRAKSDWVELNMYFYSETAGGNIYFGLFTLMKSSAFRTFAQGFSQAKSLFYSQLLGYEVDVDIPDSASIWIDKIVCEESEIPEMTGGQFNGRSLYHIRNVFMITDDVGTREIDEPIKWGDIDISINWDTTMNGYRFEFTDGEVLLEFDDAAGGQVIRKAYKEKFEGMNVFLSFGELDSANVLTILYQARINFDSISIGKYTVKANCERQSFGDKFRSRYETLVDLFSISSIEGQPLTNMPLKNLFLHPRVMTKQATGKYNTVVDPANVDLTDEFNPPGPEQWKTTVPPFKFDSNNIEDFDEPVVPQGTLIYAGLNLPPGIDKRVIYFDVSLGFQFTMGNQSGFIRAGFSIYRRGNISGGNDDLLPPYDQDVFPDCLVAAESYGNVAIPPVRTFFGRVNGILTLTGDDAIFIKVWIYTPDNDQFPISNFKYIQTQAHVFLANEQTIAEGSIISAPLIHDALNRQLEIVLDVQKPLKSDFLGRIDLGYAADGCFSKHMTMSGIMIRNIMKRHNMSTKEWFTALNGLLCMGCNIELDNDDNEFVRFEPVQYYFRNKLLFRFDVISNYEKHPALNYIYNELEFGFNKYPQDNQANSIEDWMTKMNFVFPAISTIQKKLSQVITWILSPYYIEYTRLQSFIVNPDAAYETDNNTFLISATEGTVYTGKNITFDQAKNQITIMDIVALIKGETFTISAATGGIVNGTYLATKIEIPYAYDRTIITVSSTPSVPADGTGTGTITLASERFKAKRNEDFQSTENVPSPESTYNLEHHIKRIVLRWAKIFNAGVFTQIGSYNSTIRFSTGANNVNVHTTLKNTVTCRYGSVNEGYGDSYGESTPYSLQLPLFKGNIIGFDAPLTWQTLNYLRTAFEGRNPDDLDYGYFEWTNTDGELEKGFILSLKFNPITQMLKGQFIEKYG